MAGVGATPLPVMAPLRISLMEDSRVSIRVDIVVTEGREGRERGGTRVSSSEEGGDDEGDGEGRTSIAYRRQGEIEEEQDDDQDSGQTL